MKPGVSVHNTGPREEALRAPSALKRLFGEERSAHLFALIALVGGLHALLMLGLEVNRFLYTESEIGRLQGEFAALTQEVDELRTVLHHRYDSSFREQLARINGFVYPDEQRVVTHPQPRPTPQPNASPNVERSP